MALGLLNMEKLMTSIHEIIQYVGKQSGYPFGNDEGIIYGTDTD